MRNVEERPTICYVVPELSADSEQHFAHVPSFLQELSRHADVWAIGETPSGAVELSGVRVLALRQRSRLLRAIEFCCLLSAARREGCRNVFTRISKWSALLAATWGRAIGMRSYYWVAGQGRRALPADGSMNARKARLQHRMAEFPMRLAMRFSTALVTGPERMVDYYVREYRIRPDRVRLLYNEIDLSDYELRAPTPELKRELREELRLPPDRPIVLFVGRVSPLKGGGNLLALVREMLSLAPEVLFVVVGQVVLPDVRDRLQALAPGNVRFVGSVPNPRTRRYFMCADAFCLPSVSEGFPRVVLEALAAGLPVVAFDVGGVANLLDGPYAKTVVAPGNTAAMAERLASVLEEPALVARLVACGFENVQRYSLDSVAEMFVRNLLEREPAPGDAPGQGAT